MSSSTSRQTRRLFDGTGVYIALFLVVTALAVAGYWTLIPRTPAENPIVTDPPMPDSPGSSVTLPKPQSVPAPAPKPETAPEPETAPSRPAQSAVTITVPKPEPVDLTPTPPTLIVPPLVGDAVAAFSMEELQYSETMGDWRTHDGVDLAAEAGTPVCAASAGTVTDVRDDDLMGATVVISHDGGYDTIYSNLQSVPAVAVGESVTAGQIIGSVGHTALSELRLPPHLHFGVTKDGEFIDPAEFLN